MTRLEEIQKLKERIYNPEAAKEIRELAAKSRLTFNAEEFRAYVDNHPIFSKLHLATDDAF